MPSGTKPHCINSVSIWESEGWPWRPKRDSLGASVAARHSEGQQTANVHETNGCRTKRPASETLEATLPLRLGQDRHIEHMLRRAAARAG